MVISRSESSQQDQCSKDELSRDITNYEDPCMFHAYGKLICNRRSRSRPALARIAIHSLSSQRWIVSQLVL